MQEQKLNQVFFSLEDTCVKGSGITRKRKFGQSVLDIEATTPTWRLNSETGLPRLIIGQLRKHGEPSAIPAARLPFPVLELAASEAESTRDNHDLRLSFNIYATREVGTFLARVVLRRPRIKGRGKA